MKVIVLKGSGLVAFGSNDRVVLKMDPNALRKGSVQDNWVALSSGAIPVDKTFINVNPLDAVTLTLPSARACAGYSFNIKDTSGNASSNNITLSTARPDETVDGSTTYAITTDWGSVWLHSDGLNYYVR